MNPTRHGFPYQVLLAGYVSLFGDYLAHKSQQRLSYRPSVLIHDTCLQERCCPGCILPTCLLPLEVRRISSQKLTTVQFLRVDIFDKCYRKAPSLLLQQGSCLHDCLSLFLLVFFADVVLASLQGRLMATRFMLAFFGD